MEFLMSIPAKDWHSLHPMIVHLPIGSLILLPLVILMGLFNIKKGRSLQYGAMAILLAGTIGAYIAVSTGEAGEEMAEKKAPEAHEVLEEHEELGELTAKLFTGYTVLYGIILLLPVLLKDKFKLPLEILLQVLFLLSLSYGLYVIWKTGDVGGRLVHEFGITNY